MTPVYLNPQTSSPIPFLELKGDQPHGFQVFGHVHDHDVASSSNNSCLSYTNSFNSHSSQETLSFDYSSHGGHSKVEKLVLSHEKSSDFVQPCSSWLQSTIEHNNNNGYNYGYSFHLQEEEKTIASEETNYDEDNKKSSKKWKPSKVRIMQKMMATPSNNKSSKNNNNNNNNKQQIDHQHIGKQQRQQNSSDGIRVCSDCHTTTTPLWRSGPQGPKSLCNACGIRQRKARRAAMAAAAAASFGNDTIVTPPMPSPPVEARKSASKTQEIKAERGFLDHQDKNHTLPIKKRSKIIDASKNNHTSQNSHNNNNDDTKKLCFEDFALSSNKDYLNPNPKRSFPRDEEEGAILLMALSCGLACSS